MRNCVKKNAVLHVCNDAEFRESLYSESGFKNLGHYAWLIRWFRTEHSAYLIVLEDNLRNLTATRLTDGKKVVLFHRSFGIADFTVKQTDAGKLKVMAKLGFSGKKIDDLAAVFDSLPIYK